MLGSFVEIPIASHFSFSSVTVQVQSGSVPLTRLISRHFDLISICSLACNDHL